MVYVNTQAKYNEIQHTHTQYSNEKKTKANTHRERESLDRNAFILKAGGKFWGRTMKQHGRE